MCGIFGIFSYIPNSGNINAVINGLKLLQHRGKDGSGIAYLTTDLKLKLLKILGKVREGFMDYKNLEDTFICIGHVRYSTSGKTVNNSFSTDAEKKNELQPFIGKNKHNNLISIVHNGNIPNIKQHDTQFILDIILNSNLSVEETLIGIMNTIPAAYSLLIVVDKTLYVMRDRYGIRPLCIGYKDGKVYVSSETRPLDDCTDIREIQSGEILRINENGVKTIYIHPCSVNSLCAFELIYFMNPKSHINGQSVNSIRQRLGQALAKKEKIIPKNSDYIVVGVPSSGLIAARAYADALNLQYQQLVKKVVNCVNGEDRTFILINNAERKKACRKKFKFDSEKIKDKKIILVDDTIVRGNVIQTVIESLEICGVKEVHIRIPAPPVVDRCQLGIAIQTKEELIMNNRTIGKVRDILGVLSLDYLTLDELTMFPKNAYKECFGGGIADEIVKKL